MGFTTRHRRDEYSRRFADHLPIGIGAGAIGACLAGFLEAVFVKTTHPGVTDPVLYPYAVFGYTALGAVMGAGLGFLGLVYYTLAAGKFAPHRSAASYLGATFCSIGFVLLRFRVFRDVFDEKVRAFGVKGLAVSAGLAVAACLVFLLVRALLGAAMRAGPLKGLASPRGAVGTCLVLLIASGCALGYLSWGRKPETTVESSPLVPPSEGSCHIAAGKPSFVLVIVDTLRADALGVYGRTPSPSPNLDSLARDGVVFESAVAQASWTRPAIASILTGRMPSSHTAYRKASRLPGQVETIAEVLQGRCFATHAIIDNYNVSAKNGFAQGFDRFTYLQPDYLFLATDLSSEVALYNILRKVGEKYLSSAKRVEHYYQDAQAVTDKAIERLNEIGDRSFFLLVHYMDPHDPYFVHPYSGEAYARVSLGAHPSPSLAPRMREVYEGEVAFFDEHLGRFVAELKRRDLYDKNWILLTADHGEEFYDHGGWWHGDTLYEEQIRVPLIAKPPASSNPWANLAPSGAPEAAGPGGTEPQGDAGEAPEGAGAESAPPETPGATSGEASPAGPPATEPAGIRLVPTLARHIDIMPTILAEAGVKEMPPEVQGIPLARAEPPGAAVAEEDFEGNVLNAIRTLDWKLITANPANPRGLRELELFAIRMDPAEKSNLYRPDHPDLASLETQMKAAIEGARSRAADAETAEKPTGAQEENLKALGYAGGE